MNQPNKIGILGTGLIGGSIAKGIKMRRPEVHIASLARECADLERAVEEKAVDTLFSTWEELIEFCDWIILATPLSSLASLAEEIARRCPKEKKLLVIDVGSVKKAVFPTFETLTTENLNFLSTHPMAGREKWGFAHSDPHLFQGCCWILSPHAKNRKSVVEAAAEFVEGLGARHQILDPLEHDKRVAMVSHFPALLSRLLLEFVEGQDEAALESAGPGFHSMTRLAKDNPRLQEEIGAFNSEEISSQLAKWIKFLEKKEEV